MADRDPKSLLQEPVQQQGLPPPTYLRGCSPRGPQHDPTFVVSVLIGERVAGEGEGRSKRAAERAAASAALEHELDGVEQKEDATSNGTARRASAKVLGRHARVATA